MAELRTFGVKSIKMGDDSATATILGEGNTLEGTASFTKSEDEETPFYSEEKDDAIEIITKKGPAVLEFAIVDFTPATLQRVMGGEVAVSGEWEAPDTAPDIEQYVEVITKRDVKLVINRAKIKTTIEWPLSKEELGRVVVRALVMSPTDGSKGYTIGPAA